MNKNITTDPTNPDPEAELLQARNTAYDAAYTWPKPDGTGSVDLHYTKGREPLFWDLVEHDGGADWARINGTKNEAGEVIKAGNLMLFLPHALKLLYLCSHELQDWRHLRSDRAAFIEAIEEWAGEWVPRTRHAQAVELAVQILNDSTVNTAVQMPAEGSSKTPGN